MSPQEIVSLAVAAGYEVSEFENHYCVHAKLDVRITVTVPKVSVLVRELVEKIKTLLEL